MKKELHGIMTDVPFCTCTDHECPYHPVNHDRGCDPCVAKNLRDREIPSCFFRKVAEDLGGREDFSFEGFANLVAEERRESSSGGKK